ncbi:1-deoxy-D-xylulose-5-phosphate reductoisomerase [Zoogloea sp.]|uniref:1-deoxy-D-xylulose-5-phosphate reductoisomerase n=1 Tax=Zoogloea sp. TaxID=49181 RepID=UPI002607C324|nr:1-deoxy-D-xylulose-5-phosphate reductoisomerase [Zoogloea sp.]MDD3354395.1 1-deoxy-D-xylulose-5-phosphate reductoisomerase [Zoogloea sp.]
MNSRKKLLTVLGATGSIGVSTLDVVARHPERYGIFALTAHRQVDKLFEQCRACRPAYAVVDQPADAQRLQALLDGVGCCTEVLAGPEALAAVSAAPEVDMVMAAIVGAAGLVPTLAAARAGKRILLANKEALVMSGALFMQEVAASGAELLPIDSEHNAIFQTLPAGFERGLQGSGVTRILLTASGGPFRSMPLASLSSVTPEMAVAHPNWVMGRKISVDSATMMNKGLEVIEAHWLFGAPAEQIEVVIHPQSVIHSMVAYEDGSVLAQLGNPDMRTPIAHAMAFPERIGAGVRPLDFFELGQLSFERPDLDRFPCLALAYRALKQGGIAPAVLNAANEVAVACFLEGKLRFDRIGTVVEACLNVIPGQTVESLEGVFEADRKARVVAASQVEAFVR